MCERILVLGIAAIIVGTSGDIGIAAALTPHAIIVNADQGETTISRHIYGHFAEHLGRGIYDGFWFKNSAGEWQLREDIIIALRALKIPNLRWPGGCFADYYHWKDGVGPRNERATIVNNIWGGVTEDNSFGTHEFMDLVSALRTEPVVVGNVGSGTVSEMSQWWEYFNHPGVSPMANLRGENGRSEPWNVRFWGVGNESWGCGGNMRPDYYADLYKRFATFLHAYGETRAFRIAAGGAGDDYRWTEVMMRAAASMIDGIDIHHYTLVGNWDKKGHAIHFPESEWLELMSQVLKMDDIITGHSEIMDRYDPEKRIWLIVGEWGTWHEPADGSVPGFLYQQNTLRDALAASLTLNIFNRHADRVKMANIAQTVNVLQAMVLTEGDQMILTPTYHVFDFYSVHHDATLLPLSLSGEDYEHDGEAIPALDATASLDSVGTINITLTNVDPHREHLVRTSIRGQNISRVSGRILTGASMNDHNTFSNPRQVAPERFQGATLSGDVLTVLMPPRSLVVLSVK